MGNPGSEDKSLMETPEQIGGRYAPVAIATPNLIAGCINSVHEVVRTLAGEILQET